MSQTTTMTVRLSGPLSDFVAANVGEHGDYEAGHRWDSGDD